MRKQIQCLATKIKHLETCNTLNNCNNKESTEIAEQNPTTTPFLPQPPSPSTKKRKCNKLATFKKLASAEDRMQTLKKRFEK